MYAAKHERVRRYMNFIQTIIDMKSEPLKSSEFDKFVERFINSELYGSKINIGQYRRGDVIGADDYRCRGNIPYENVIANSSPIEVGQSGGYYLYHPEVGWKLWAVYSKYKDNPEYKSFIETVESVMMG